MRFLFFFSQSVFFLCVCVCVDWVLQCCVCVGCRTRILRHMASQLNLEMRSDGFVRIRDLLRLNLATSAHIKLNAHTVDDIREV